MSVANKKIRILCSVLSLFSLLAIVPIMYSFFYVTYYDVYVSYTVYGFGLYTDKAIYIFVGVLGLIALLWDLVSGAYAVIDGRCRPLIWKIARYNYFYGAVAGIVNFFLVLSLLINYESCTFASILFLLMVAIIAGIKIYLVFTKEKDETKQPLV